MWYNNIVKNINNKTLLDYNDINKIINEDIIETKVLCSKIILI